jgi:site-specific recombinase XerD
MTNAGDHHAYNSPPSGDLGGGGWRARFLRPLGEADLAPLTLRGYGHELALFERWYGTAREKSFSPSALGPLDLVKYRQHLITVERLKPATANPRLEALRRFSRWAVSQGVLSVDVGREVKPVKMTTRSQPCGLREPEVHALLRVPVRVYRSWAVLAHPTIAPAARGQ